MTGIIPRFLLRRLYPGIVGGKRKRYGADGGSSNNNNINIGDIFFLFGLFLLRFCSDT
jgi:hypothetical protein